MSKNPNFFVLENSDVLSLRGTVGLPGFLFPFRTPNCLQEFLMNFTEFRAVFYGQKDVYHKWTDGRTTETDLEFDSNQEYIWKEI